MQAVLAYLLLLTWLSLWIAWTQASTQASSHKTNFPLFASPYYHYIALEMLFLLLSFFFLFLPPIQFPLSPSLSLPPFFLFFLSLVLTPFFLIFLSLVLSSLALFPSWANVNKLKNCVGCKEHWLVLPQEKLGRVTVVVNVLKASLTANVLKMCYQLLALQLSCLEHRFQFSRLRPSWVLVVDTRFSHLTSRRCTPSFSPRQLPKLSPHLVESRLSLCPSSHVLLMIASCTTSRALH